MKDLACIKLALLFFLLVFAQSALATDLKFHTVITVDYWENEEEDTAKVIIENDNVLTAFTYSVSFEIKDWNNNIVFADEVQPEPILPFTTLEVKASIGWTPTLTGTYTLTSRIDFADDIDTSNNTGSGSFPVIWGLDVGISKFRDWSLRLCPDTSDAWGFMPQKPLEAGTELESEDSTEFSLSLNSWKYYGYLDCNKYARYAHLGYAITIDAIDTSQVDTFKVNYWTKIDGWDYMPGLSVRLDTADAVFGTEPEFEEEESSETITQNTTPEPADSVCAILVSGEGKDPSEQMAFDFDVDLVKKNLMFEELGPKLPEGNIVVLNNASRVEIFNALFALTNNYRKLIFYYSGHGWKGGIDTRDTNFLSNPSYFELSERMAQTNIEELEVIIDACHAGSAIDFFDGFMWREKDVTLIAACAEDTVSYTRRLFITANGDTIRVGAYTWFLVKCFGDPDADKDGIPGVSWAESYEWVRSRNETFGTRNVNRDLMPQLYIHKAEPPRQPVNIPQDMDLEFTSDQPDSNATYYFEMRTDFSDFSTFDTTVTSFSKYRYWSYSSSLDVGTFAYNLKFTYDTELDSFDTSTGEPGILFRDSSGVEWEKYNNYTWSAESTYVQGFGMDKYGDYALGTIRLVVDVNDDEQTVSNFALRQNYPNPFNPVTKIVYELPKAQNVKIAVFDILGRQVAVLLNEQKKQGRHTLEFKATEFSSGLYFYRIETESFTDTRKMILLK